MRHYNRVLLALIGLLISSLALASTYNSVYKTPYVDARNQKISAKLLNQSGKPTLILLWANWCEPCKKELKWAVDALAQQSTFHVVTVNVDESAEQNSAKAFLAQIQSPLINLFDTDGEHFYSYHESGQLPLVLVFAPDGSLIKRFSSFDEDRLREASSLVTGVNAGSDEGIVIRNQLRYRSQKMATGPEQKVIAERLNSHFSSEDFELSVNYDQLHQTKADGKFRAYEDELGYSYLHYKPRGSRWDLRLGGQNLLIGDGYSLSLRTNRELNENLFLTGVFIGYNHPSFSVLGFHGQVRNNLYPAILDPSSDLSETIANSTSQGLSVRSTKFNLGPAGLALDLNAVQVLRDAYPQLGFFSDYRDTRLGLTAAIEFPWLDLKTINMHYEAADDQEISRYGQLYSVTSKPLQQQHYTVFMNAEQQRVNITRNDIFPYINVPVLTDELTTPLIKRNREDRRLRLRLSVPHFYNLFIEPIYAEQFTLEKQSLHELYNSGIKFGLADLRLKGQYSQARNIDRELMQLGQERIIACSFPLGLPTLSGFIEQRQIKLSQLTNNSRINDGHRATYGVNWQKSLADHALDVDLYHYLLSGQYFSASGLPDQRLWAQKIRYSFRWLAFSAIFGKEPGGYMCTAGHCQYLEPRNGLELSTEIHLAF